GFLEQHAESAFLFDDCVRRRAGEHHAVGGEPRCAKMGNYQPPPRLSSSAKADDPAFSGLDEKKAHRPRTATGYRRPAFPGMTTQRAYGTPSMRPGIATVGGEIVGVRQAAAHGRLGLEDLIGNAVTLAVGDRFLRSVEAQLHLLTHITRTRPAHQRLDL